ncbi:MAG: hypothetical protein ACLGHT_03715 [Acidimicrobiia bacterium]
MKRQVRAYQAALRLYPAGFRREYSADMVDLFARLVEDRGAAATWRRCAVDLAVSVPRYRLEAVMNRPATSTTVFAVAGLLAAAGIITLSLGAAPGIALGVLAGAVALTQRSALARSLDAGPSQRRRWAAAAAGSAAVFASSVGSWLYHVDNFDSLSDTSLMLHGLVGSSTIVATVVFGLLAIFARDPKGVARAA